MKIARALHDEILRHGEKAWPEEACGLLLADAAGRFVEVVAIANAAEKMRRDAPDEWTRGARQGYVMDPKEQMRAWTDAERRGLTVAAIWHSHPDVGAYFSAEDRTRAAPEGEPIFPGVVWIVADVRQAKGVGSKAFVWSERTKDFVEATLEVE